MILTVEKQTSECHLSKTNTMHIIQMAQEQHALYFGYALGVLGKFYRNRKGLKKEKSIISAEGRREQVQLSP